MSIEIIDCPRCGCMAYRYEDGHGECQTCGISWYDASERR